MTGPLALPNPYLPGLPGSGLGTDPNEFADRVQQNMDAIALAIGNRPLAARAGSQIGRTNITSPVTVSSATEATGTTILTASAYSFDGLPVVAEFFSPNVAAAANDIVILSLFEGATQIGRLGVLAAPAASPINSALFLAFPFTPSAGSHTYKVTAHRTAADGTVGAGTGGTGAYGAAFLRFMREA